MEIPGDQSCGCLMQSPIVQTNLCGQVFNPHFSLLTFVNASPAKSRNTKVMSPSLLPANAVAHCAPIF